MRSGVWDIQVPASRDVVTPNLMIAPLLGFDRDRYRLGNGGGYFDRTLAARMDRPFVIGVGYASGEATRSCPSFTRLIRYIPAGQSCWQNAVAPPRGPMVAVAADGHPRFIRAERQSGLPAWRRNAAILRQGATAVDGRDLSQTIKFRHSLCPSGPDHLTAMKPAVRAWSPTKTAACERSPGSRVRTASPTDAEAPPVGSPPLAQAARNLDNRV